MHNNSFQETIIEQKICSPFFTCSKYADGKGDFKWKTLPSTCMFIITCNHSQAKMWVKSKYQSRFFDKLYFQNCPVLLSVYEFLNMLFRITYSSVIYLPYQTFKNVRNNFRLCCWLMFSRGQILSPWLGDKVDSGIGLTVDYGTCVAVGAGVDISRGYSQIRNRVPYTMFSFGFGLSPSFDADCKLIKIPQDVQS